MEITNAKISKSDVAKITVRFVSEQVNILKNKDGEVIEGDENFIQNITDSWTFERALTSTNPNWLLVSTKSNEPHFLYSFFLAVAVFLRQGRRTEKEPIAEKPAAAETAPKIELLPTTFGALGNWKHDNLSQAARAFADSCAKISGEKTSICPMPQ